MMPGANYFLSKLAAQTPGPLVGDGSPKTPPPSCMDVIPVSAARPEDEIHMSRSLSKQLAVIPPKDISASAVGNGFGRPFMKTFPFGPAALSFITKGTFVCQLPITTKGLDENPVGELQELCTKMRWVFPTYSVCCENGQPHERTFVVVVRLYNIREKGDAKSKKAAKREAARRLLIQLLQRSGSGVGAQNFFLENRHQAVEYQTSTNIFSTQQPPRPHFESYDEPNVRCIDLLQELGGRRNFRIIYLRLDTKTASGLTQVMLQVSTCPLVVVRGEGHTVLAAKADAALNALECIRLTYQTPLPHKVSFSP